MAKDYYFVLGVSRGADLHKIKRAYRTIVKKYHPDVSRSRDGGERFQEVREAYETLIDEEKREKYDRELNGQRANPRMSQIRRSASKKPSPLDHLERFWGATDEFFEGFVPGFFDTGLRRSQQKNLYYEAILSPREAENGGLFPVSVPVIEPCPSCRATDIWETFSCATCSGTGKIQSKREFSLSIPPHVTHGTQISLSMEDIGLRDVLLHVTVLIDATIWDE